MGFSAWVEVPYMREGRRIIGRLGSTSRLYCGEIDISRRDYNDDYYRQTLLPEIYRRLKTVLLAGLETAVIAGTKSLEETTRTRSTIYPILWVLVTMRLIPSLHDPQSTRTAW